jgi:folate-binding protein YgfZ
VPELITNPLHPLHQQSSAEFQSYGDIEIVSTFDLPQAEYTAIHKACGLMDLPQRGILELNGKDRLSFLNNFLTNQTWDKATKTPMAPGKGCYAFLLNNQGRVVADMNVLELGDRTYLEMDRRMVEEVQKSFDKFLFSEQVKMQSRLGALHEIALHGPGALAIINAHVAAAIPELGAMDSAKTQAFGAEVLIWRDDACGVPGYHVILPVESAAAAWNGFAAPYAQQTNKRDLRPVGWAAFNTARIEAGRALFGIDFDNTILPAETGQLDRAVSFTKGCYLGQEVVARMHARGQFAKKLVGIRMSGEELPIAGSQIFDEKDNAIGGVTSSTISPILSRTALCLGYVKKNFVAEGTGVRIPAEGAIHMGTVAKTPFG